MSRPLAVTCLLLNVVLPGLGTLVSGLTVLCGSQVRPKGASRGSVLWTNSGVALLQFFLTFLLLLGWIWSIMWGTAFLSISKEYYKKSHVEEVSTNGPPKPSSTPKREHRRDSNSSTQRHAQSDPGTSSRGHTHSPAPPHPSAHHHPQHHHHHQNHHQHQQQQQQQQQPAQHRNGLSVNAVGGTLTTPDIYLTPSSSSTPCTSERTQPIIVLQEAPITVNRSDTPPAPSRALMNARTRHEKILQRQMSDNELSPFILTHQQLEAIVIHDAPVLSRPPRSAGVDETDPNFALPKL